ncbi:MAG TPA: radical SAM protein [Smithellaceae bacterium]|nr:radical SAM protein [Smithellaceae bacterium]HRS88643.1 radical SAM protein [Smithellaceae bacterium]HRV25923.1 radical SAM protein [Smithellaceae bacterium]
MRVAVVASPYPLEENPSPPLGVTYVAAAFVAAGADVRIFDYIVSGYSREKISGQLDDFQPDAVGATSVTMNFFDAQKILRDVKSCNHEIITMMGGPHVSFAAAETLRRYPEIDLVVIGEAEDTIAELTPVLKQKNKWRDIRGLAYRENGAVVITDKRPFIADVDRINPPARRLLPISRYRALGFPVSMITSRGCPNACIFCLGRKMVGAKIRRRSANCVLDEIEQILELGFERINIADDLFTSDRERVLEICRGINKRNLKFGWSAFARVDTVNPEVLAAMAAAGCDSVSFGVETGDPQMLKRIRKGIKLTQAAPAVQMCKEAGIVPHVSFMVGLPGETLETMHASDRLARSLNVLYGYHYLAPFPGTTVREQIEKYDLEILTDDWAKYDANDAIVRTSALSPDDIRAFVARYDEEMYTDWEKLLAGYVNKTNTPLENMRVEGYWRMHLTFKILKNDLIEKYGLIERAQCDGSAQSSLQELSKRIIAATEMEPRIVNHALNDFAARGYLKAKASGDGCRWMWTDDI